MEENTLFQGNDHQGQPEHVASESASTASHPPAEQGSQLFGGFPPPSHDDEEHHFPLGLILKIVLGVLLLLCIAIGVYAFVIPKFFSGSAKEVTLTYWGLWESENVMRQVITDFERQNPTIKVKYIQQDSKEYRQRLNARIPNGNGPDIFRYHNTWFPMVGKYLAPLPESVVTKAVFQQSNYPVVQQDVVRNGAIYGIPLSMDTLTMFVNKDLLSAAGASVPTTWDEFDRVTRIITVKDETGKIKTAGTAMGTFDNISHAPEIVSLLFVQNGADIRNLSNTPENASDALTYYTSFAQGEGKIWDETLDNSLVMFARGDVGMYFGYSWDVFAIKAANPSLNFATYPVPRIPGRDATIANYWVEGVSIKSIHQKEAMLFMQFLAKKETQQKLFTEEAKTRLFGELYADVSLASTLQSNVLAYPFIQQAKTATSTFFVADTFDDGLNEDMNTYLGNAVRSVLANTSPQTAIDTLAKGVAQILTQYGQ